MRIEKSFLTIEMRSNKRGQNQNKWQRDRKNTILTKIKDLIARKKFR
jgi:hypothetical protein